MCNCIKEVNQQLEDLNTTIDTLFINRVCIRTRKIDVKIKGNKAEVIVEFCPFCGENYLKEEGKIKQSTKRRKKSVDAPVAATDKAVKKAVRTTDSPFANAVTDKAVKKAVDTDSPTVASSPVAATDKAVKKAVRTDSPFANNDTNNNTANNNHANTANNPANNPANYDENAENAVSGEGPVEIEEPGYMR